MSSSAALSFHDDADKKFKIPFHLIKSDGADMMKTIMADVNAGYGGALGNSTNGDGVTEWIYNPGATVPQFPGVNGGHTSFPYEKYVPAEPIDLDKLAELLKNSATETALQQARAWEDRYNQAAKELATMKDQVAALQEQIERLKKENRNMRLRPGQARTVEDEPEGS